MTEHDHTFELSIDGTPVIQVTVQNHWYGTPLGWKPRITRGGRTGWQREVSLRAFGWLVEVTT